MRCQKMDSYAATTEIVVSMSMQPVPNHCLDSPKPSAPTSAAEKTRPLPCRWQPQYHWSVNKFVSWQEDSRRFTHPNLVHIMSNDVCRRCLSEAARPATLIETSRPKYKAARAQISSRMVGGKSVLDDNTIQGIARSGTPMPLPAMSMDANNVYPARSLPICKRGSAFTASDHAIAIQL